MGDRARGVRIDVTVVEGGDAEALLQHGHDIHAAEAEATLRAGIIGYDFKSLYNPSFLMLQLHRSFASISYAGFFMAGWCGIRLYTTKVKEKIKYYEDCGLLSFNIAFASLLSLPVIGYFYSHVLKTEAPDAFWNIMLGRGDVHVGGVTAYSTLGWFSDSVFSTIVRRDEIATAALIFHELAHQILYVSDDTTFNESFATTVEQEGLRRWMAANSNPLGYQAYVLQGLRRQEFLVLVATYREKLAELYRQENRVPEEMRRRKSSLFADMRDEYALLKAGWHGYTGYDNWFGTTLNNAKLNAVGTYYDLVPAFTQLLASQDGDLQAFYAKCRILAGLPKSERNRRLLSLQPPAVADAAIASGALHRPPRELPPGDHRVEQIILEGKVLGIGHAELELAGKPLSLCPFPGPFDHTLQDVHADDPAAKTAHGIPKIIVVGQTGENKDGNA